MITIGEMQISGVLTMAMLSAMLMLCIPHRSIRRSSFTHARWLMAAGTGLIALQFMLQYIFGFRQMGVTQAVLCNLLLFTPATLLCSMAILCMQRHGKVSRKEWVTVCSICALTELILLTTMLTDGVPIEQESQALRMAEYAGGVLYVLMQSYIFVKQYKAYQKLELVVGEYFDRERNDLFGWMGLSMKTMALLAFFVPFIIFLNGKPLVLFSVAYFFCISYSTISLYSYGVSEDISRVEEAEKSEEDEELYVRSKEESDRQPEGESPLTATSISGSSSHGICIETIQRVENAVEQWTASESYKEHNLTLSVVARQMGVTRKQLQEWLRTSEYRNLAGLIAPLRINEAKRVLKQHSEWSIESIADHCGFSSREYFHRAFRDYTGMTPAKYQQGES